MTQTDGTATDFQSRIIELLDKQEITEVIMRYARAIDRLDWRLWAECFHDDGVFDISMRRIKPCQEYRARGGAVSGHATWTDITMHYMANCLIELDGNIARAETYCLALHRTRVPDDELPEWIGPSVDGAGDGPRDAIAGIRYVDRFERRGGLWKIAHRVIVWDWTRLDAVDAVSLIDAPRFHQGRRDDQDLAYRGV